MKKQRISSVMSEYERES